ncbi:hypothetical protein [Catellatospora tritici]|uniref:hypothetical protein n=1 Tax=Catellatospora tritici TaxID=2851566 RepID=UPI001C2DB36A|nr:hypothetical protein [Catellatospora tritici]MBV1853491.1 hypothetical protein [Catellatospora tritici]
MSTPPLLAQLLDDAAVFPPGSATLPDAVSAHRVHRTAWYAGLVGPLLVPASQLGQLAPLLSKGEALAVGVIGDGPLADCFAVPPAGVRVVQVEAAMARRGEDPLPTLAAFTALLREHDLRGFAEIPLAWGLLAALDALAEARAGGLDVSAKFRTGGLAAELFPTPMELAAVIIACHERQLPFKLTAGLHHAIRHTDPETGFTHHGFLNVLAAACAAADGMEVAEVAGLLATTQPLTLIEAVRTRRSRPRPLWCGFGTCSIPEPLADLQKLGLLDGSA